MDGSDFAEGRNAFWLVYQKRRRDAVRLRETIVYYVRERNAETCVLRGIKADTHDSVYSFAATAARYVRGVHACMYVRAWSLVDVRGERTSVEDRESNVAKVYTATFFFLLVDFFRNLLLLRCVSAFPRDPAATMLRARTSFWLCKC